MQKESDQLKHCASIDLEDWYNDVECVVPPDSVAFRQAFDRQMNRIQSIFDETGTRCTFFVLGRTAERYPAWIKRLHTEGHEIATHGYGHDRIPMLNRVSFRADVRRSLDVIGDLIGVRPQGYRAPYFSLGSGEAWVYEILADEGLCYSSSVFPFPGRHYGIRDHPKSPLRVVTPSGTLIEMPLSVVDLAGRRLPVAGGGFWRATPLLGIRLAAKRIAREGRSFVMYLHPHEFDSEPLRSHKGILRNAYVNLGRPSIAGKLRHILERFSFAPISAVISSLPDLPYCRVEQK